MRSVLLLAAAACAFIPVSQAQEYGGGRFMAAKHVLGVGATYQKADAGLRASVPSLPETEIDLDDLGMDDSNTSWALEYRWRFAPKWLLVAMAYTFAEDGRRSVERDFNFDGTEFTAGTSVDTSLTLDTYIVNLLYQVYASDRAEIMLGGGLHAINLDNSITARAFIGDVDREVSSGDSELLAPLPNLKATASYRFGEKWGALLSLGWLSANYEDYDGSFVYAHPRIGYQISDKWGATLGYQYVDIDLTRKKSSNREVALDATFTGPTLFLNYRF
jgi:opacity protein-like surface antigen